MTTEQRFWIKVRKTRWCWYWTASLRNGGYGAFAYTSDGRVVHDRAHRYSWRIHRGAIPRGLFVLHSCDTPSCVRPDHLFLGTNADNVADMMAKGRHVSGGRKTPVESCKYQRGCHHHAAKLNDADVVRIRRARAAGDSYGAISRREHLAIGHVFRIVNRQAWRHIK